MERATAIDKAIDVLFLLRKTGQPSGVTDIARGLSLPKSSAHRLLCTLTRRGMVERDGRGRYRLGFGLMFLGQGVPECEPLVMSARPELEAAAHALSETCFLVAARGGKLVVLDRVEGRGILRASPEVGAVVPVDRTAVGQLYLHHAPEQLDEQTVAPSEGEPRSELGAVDDEGYAYNFGQWIEGVTVYSAPVWVHGRLVAAIAVAIPSSRVTDHGASGVVAQLKGAVARIASRAEGATV